MDFAEQPLIINSHHHDYASTDTKGSLANPTPTEAPYSDTSAPVCFYKLCSHDKKKIGKCI